MYLRDSYLPPSPAEIADRAGVGRDRRRRMGKTTSGLSPGPLRPAWSTRGWSSSPGANRVRAGLAGLPGVSATWIGDRIQPVRRVVRRAFGADDDQSLPAGLCRQLASEIGIDWRVWFTPGGNQPDGPVPDTCTIANGKGRGLVTWSDGIIVMEEEPVPDEFMALADRYGNSFSVARERGWELTLPTTRNRELEPDELTTERTYLYPASEDSFWEATPE
jgi:hypothetical protein